MQLLRRLARVFRQLDVRRHRELELFSSEQDSRRAMRRAALKLLCRPVFLLTVVGAVALSLTSTLVLRQVVSNLGLPISQLVQNLILAVPVMLLCCGFGLWVLNRHLSKLLRHELLANGVPVCLECGYHLIGLPSATCPECGRPFDAQVRRILERDASEAARES